MPAVSRNAAKMAPKVSNKDIAASASDRHRNKRRRINPENDDDASNDSDTAAAAQQLQDTLAAAAGPSSQVEEIPRPFSKTPPELRLMIAKYAMEEWDYSLIVNDDSGERLGNIWRRVYWLTATNDRHATERRTHRQVVRMGNTSNTLFDVKVAFSRQVPALLRVGHDLREEGREEFLKVARRGLAKAEVRNKFDRQYCKVLLTHFNLSHQLNSLQKQQRGPVTYTDDMVVASWEDMQRQTVDMVCNALRWYALRHVCELLGLQPLEHGRKALGTLL